MTMMTRDVPTLASSADQQAQNCIVKQLDPRISYPSSTHTAFFWFGLPLTFRLALAWAISWMPVSGSHASCVLQEFLLQFRFMQKESRHLPHVNISTTRWHGWEVCCKSQLSSEMKHKHKCMVSVLRVILQELYRVIHQMLSCSHGLSINQCLWCLPLSDLQGVMIDEQKRGMSEQEHQWLSPQFRTIDKPKKVLKLTGKRKVGREQMSCSTKGVNYSLFDE